MRYERWQTHFTLRHRAFNIDVTRLTDTATMEQRHRPFVAIHTNGAGGFEFEEALIIGSGRACCQFFGSGHRPPRARCSLSFPSLSACQANMRVFVHAGLVHHDAVLAFGSFIEVIAIDKSGANVTRFFQDCSSLCKSETHRVNGSN